MSALRRLRVMVLDRWDEIPLELPLSTPIGVMKRAALQEASVKAPASDFVVKFRGARLLDEATTLEEAGIPEDAGLIVLRERRLAVR